MNTLIVLTDFCESRSNLIVAEGDYRHLSGLDISPNKINDHFPKNKELFNLIFDEEGLIKTNGYNLSTEHQISIELLQSNKIEFIIFCRSQSC